MRICFLTACFALAAAVQGAVELERLPDGGIQPRLAAGPDGTIHLMVFKGDPMGGDIFYYHRAAAETNWPEPLRVNSVPGSVIAAGTMRGPQMALGRWGRIHAAWMGGNGAAKVDVAGHPSTPMLYARLNGAGTAFEPQRNLITRAGHLDGGGTVAASADGRVYVLWHGAPPEVEGEQERAVYIARSEDGGRTFAPEAPILKERTGSCACCGMNAFALPDGNLFVLFRAAFTPTDRPMLLAVSSDGGRTFRRSFAHPWEVATCPASSAFLRSGGETVLAAWETENQVHAARFDPTGKMAGGLMIPAGEARRKHPAAAENQRGEVLLAWVEPRGWGEPATLGWQLFRDGQSAGEPGAGTGLPAWSFPAIYTAADGSFRILY